tara:strand:- start:131 stop:1183 length:1053 start_codon:yes stop_codon:yes gene_type:complete
MSDLRINNITNGNGDAGPTIAGVSTVATSAFMVMPISDTEIRGAGSGRGVIFVNNQPSTKTLNKIEIATTGNADDFGDSMVSKNFSSYFASSTRGIFAGGQPSVSPYYISDIEYVIISSSGGGIDFGDLSKGSSTLIADRGSAAGSNDSTRGLIAGGRTPSDGGGRKDIDFVTMASTGDSVDFGELVQARSEFQGGMANGTRAVFAGGYTTTDFFSIIDTVNVQSKGEATKFGELSALKARLTNTSNSTRGLTMGGKSPSPGNPTNIIEFITMSTEGNAQDFGDLTNTVMSMSACSSRTRSVQCGGITPSNTNTLQFVTISTTGDATDFGDMTAAFRGNAAVSDVNGGLG